MRGMLTNRINKIAKKMIGREISQKELRLIPYIQYLIINEQKLDPRKINSDERIIIQKWKGEGFFESGMTGISITKQFWDFMCEVLFESYVKPTGEINYKMNENKILKKVLFITDDFDDEESINDLKELCEPGDVFSDNNWLKFKITIIDNFEHVNLKEVDIVLIDWGLIGNNRKVVELFRKIYLKEIPMIWCGAMPSYYQDEVKKKFPRLKFLHDISACGIEWDGIVHSLYFIFTKQLEERYGVEI